MLRLRKIRELDLGAPVAPDRLSHLSAASGLVHLPPWLYVVADDELHLGVFDSASSRPGNLIRILPGELPDSPKKRKAKKPDTEALILLPQFAECPHGALLALGSGSKPNRRVGILLPFDQRGLLHENPRTVDLSRVYARLDDEINGLNIEGGVVYGDDFFLLQRGNKGEGCNALIRFSLPEVLSILDSNGNEVPLPLAIDEINLGAIDGVPLGFTDGAALPNGNIVFSAVAEATDDSYVDGPCAGAAVGLLTRDGKLLALHYLEERHKIEGIEVSVVGDQIRLLAVTDADNADIAAGLYSTTLPKHPASAAQ